MIDTTIIYYTANRENEEFENKIIDNINKVKGDLPVISVSQKPMDFGKNICVGIQEASDSNAFRQLLIGLKEAKTKYAIAAEADTLYPPEYFNFIPPTDDNVYRYTNLWIKWRHKSVFYKKYYVEGAQSCNREFWIKMLERRIDDSKGWSPYPVEKVFDTQGKYFWISENPVIIFKTGGGLRTKAPYILKVPPVTSLPYWGSCREITQKYEI